MNSFKEIVLGKNTASIGTLRWSVSMKIGQYAMPKEDVTAVKFPCERRNRRAVELVENWTRTGFIFVLSPLLSPQRAHLT